MCPHALFRAAMGERLCFAGGVYRGTGARASVWEERSRVGTRAALSRKAWGGGKLEIVDMVRLCSGLPFRGMVPYSGFFPRRFAHLGRIRVAGGCARDSVSRRRSLVPHHHLPWGLSIFVSLGDSRRHTGAHAACGIRLGTPFLGVSP